MWVLFIICWLSVHLWTLFSSYLHTYHCQKPWVWILVHFGINNFLSEPSARLQWHCVADWVGKTRLKENSTLYFAAIFVVCCLYLTHFRFTIRNPIFKQLLKSWITCCVLSAFHKGIGSSAQVGPVFCTRCTRVEGTYTLSAECSGIPQICLLLLPCGHRCFWYYNSAIISKQRFNQKWLDGIKACMWGGFFYWLS